MRTSQRRWTLIPTLLAALLTGLLMSINPSSAAPAPLAAENDAPAAKPTIVFVHGGWADSSGWNAEIAAFQQDGYPVIAAANPLRGLASDAAYVRSVLRTIDGPIILVGHSYGGAVISNAAVGVPNVKALVYIAAFAPDAGESLAQLVNQFPGTQITPAALDERPYPLADGGQGVDLYLKKEIFREAFAGDLPRRVTDLMQATQRPFSVAAFTEPSAEPAWKTIPSWYLIATDDHAIPPAAQAFMSARAGSNVSQVKASHVPMQSQPDATIRIIRKAISSAS
ncbi:alpha/beta hydrolase [Nocardioides sp. NPDC126508]